MRLNASLGLLLVSALAAFGADAPAAIKILAYGDTRFTSGWNREVTNAKIRRWLVQKIATEKPDALFISGDIPFRGGSNSDWKIFQAETAAWREAQLHVYPALGNHEFMGEFMGACGEACLDNWWRIFPELQGHRWYSTRVGPLLALTLDSTSPLVRNSPQYGWFENEMAHVPQDVQFLLINMHHPPIADVQIHGDPDHNPRANEESIIPLLKEFASQSHARVLVVAGHVHNYERREQDGVEYVTSGGGGAKPRHVERTPGDLYTRTDEPNFHYLRITIAEGKLKAVMVRVKNTMSSSPEWEEADTFELIPKQ